MEKQAEKPSLVRKVDTGEIATQVIIRMLVERLVMHGDKWDKPLTRKEWGPALRSDHFFTLMTNGKLSRLDKFNSSGGFLESKGDKYVATNKLRSTCFES